MLDVWEEKLSEVSGSESMKGWDEGQGIWVSDYVLGPGVMMNVSTGRYKRR